MATKSRKRTRKYISLREKLAAALAMLLPQEQRDELRAKKIPAKTVISLFDQDHNILHSMGGSDRWWNLTPLLRAPHKEKSKKDTGIVAKVKALSKDQVEFQRKLLARKPGQKRKPKGNFPTGRKIQSRGFT